MTQQTAKRIGSRQGLLSAIAGLVIAQLIMTFFVSLDQDFPEAFFWFSRTDYKLNLFTGSVILLLCGHFYGQWAGKAILLKRRNPILTGILCGLAVLLSTAFLSGWPGFFREGMDNLGTGDNPFEDYILKPFFWIAVFGFLPALLMGIWLGWRVQVKGSKPARTKH